MTTLTASLRLQLLDALSGPSKAATRALKGLESSIETLGKRGLSNARNLSGQFNHLRQKAAALDNFKSLRKGTADAAIKMRAARVNVQQLQAALAKATGPTKKLESEIRSATNTLKHNTNAFTQQREAMRAAEQGLKAFGLNGRAAIDRSQSEIRSQLARTLRQMREMDRESRRLRNLPQPRMLPPARVVGGAQKARRGLHRIGSIIDPITGYVGFKAEEAAGDMVTEGAERQQAINQIRNVSGSEDEVEKAKGIAAKVSGKYPYTTQAQALHDYAEQRSLATSEHPGQPIDFKKMERNSLIVAQTRAALASSGQEFGAEDVRNLMFALEGAGRANDPRAVQQMFDAYVRAKQVGGTAIDPSSIRDFVTNAKAANFSMAGGDAWLTAMARMFQGNSSRLGNEFAQTLSTLIGGKMTKQGAQWLANNGIISPEQIVKGGGGKFFIKGGVKNADLLSTDQTAWAQQVLFPAIKAKGALSDEKVHKRVALLRKSEPDASDEVLEEKAIHGLIADSLQKSGFRQTVIDNLSHAIANEIITEKNVSMMKDATGLGAADTLSQNPIAAYQEMMNSLANFSAVLTSPAMENASGILHALSASITEFSASLQDWQKDHPEMAKAAGYGAPIALATAGAAMVWKTVSSLFGHAAHAGEGAASAGAGYAGAAMGWLSKLKIFSVLGTWAQSVESLGDTPGDTFEKQVENQKKAREALQRLFGIGEDDEIPAPRYGPLTRGRDKGAIDRERSLDDYLNGPSVRPPAGQPSGTIQKMLDGMKLPVGPTGDISIRSIPPITGIVTTQPSGTQQVQVMNPTPIHAPINVTVYATTNASPAAIADSVAAKVKATTEGYHADLM